MLTENMKSLYLGGLYWYMRDNDTLTIFLGEEIRPDSLEMHTSAYILV